MLKNYLKVISRTLLRNKIFSLINIAGLAIGLACSILILLYVQDELSFDSFHEKADRIYRVACSARLMNSEFEAPVTPAPMAAALLDEFPEVVQVTRLWTFTGRLPIRYEDKRFIEELFFYADSTFFEVFSIEFFHGDAETALTQPNSVVLTEAMATKYFGFEYPVGKTLTMGKATGFIVTGVVRDFPHNSHFHPDFLASMSSLAISKNTFWVSNSFYTHLLLQEDYPRELVESKLSMIVRKYAGPQIQMAMGISYDDFLSTSNRLNYYLQPLRDIRLHSNLQFEIEPSGNILYVYTFLAIAFLVLLIACFNFMNLSTARATNRAKEVGVRKVFGSHRIQLISQFLSESLVLSFLALVLAVFLVQLALPAFNDLTGKQFSLDYLQNMRVLAGLLLLSILVGFLAGSYPAFYLSSFQTVSVIKGKLLSGVRGTDTSLIRAGLVVLQFTLSIVLLVAAIVVHNQLDFMKSKSLGFDKSHLLLVQDAGALGKQQEAFKQKVLQNPNVISVSASSSLPGGLFSQTAFAPEGVSTGQTFVMSPLIADYDFLPTYSIEVLQGRGFSREFRTDSTALVVNRAAARTLGWEDPVGKRLTLVSPTRSFDQTGEIIGVIEDFHFESLHRQVGPMVIGVTGTPLPFLSVRLQPENLSKAIDFLESAWQKFVPEQPFEYAFLADRLNALYGTEEKWSNVVGYFSLMAIVIACLGLVGLASYTSELRGKEIGVRKVFGASLHKILILLIMDFTKLILIAMLIATPLAWLVINKWLQEFAFRVTVDWQPFLLAGGAALLLALLTVSYQTVKAALTNPVEVLKYE